MLHVGSNLPSLGLNTQTLVAVSAIFWEQCNSVLAAVLAMLRVIIQFCGLPTRGLGLAIPFGSLGPTSWPSHRSTVATIVTMAATETTRMMMKMATMTKVVIGQW